MKIKLPEFIEVPDNMPVTYFLGLAYNLGLKPADFCAGGVDITLEQRTFSTQVNEVETDNKLRAAMGMKPVPGSPIQKRPTVFPQDLPPNVHNIQDHKNVSDH